jgi:glycosyltransferase involved in cell wall biosynthesis
MRALRLCFVGPANSISLRRWMQWFTARGHETTVVTVEPAEMADVKGFRQIDVGTMIGPGKIGRLLSSVRLALAVRRLKPDIVHVHYARGLAWGLLLARPHPCVVTPWGSDVLKEQGAFREWYSGRLTRAMLSLADLVTVHSGYMEEQVRPLLPATKPIARVGWGVDLRLFRDGLEVRSLRERWGIAADRRVIFSPRLAQPFYHHDRIIRAFADVARRIPAALLVLSEQFAQPGYVSELRRLAADLDIADRLRFVGAIPYHDMPLWLNLAETVVMMPTSDGMPNSLLEAMACGSVPVLRKLPQYDEVIRHGVNGLLVDPDPKEIAGALVHVLTDTAGRERMNQTNRKLVAEIADQEREMSRMEGWYAGLAEAGIASSTVLQKG